MSIGENKLSILQSDLRVIEICNSDSQLSKLIRIIVDIEIELRQDYFQSLIKSIISQQLSPKSASTIYSRLEHRFNGIVEREIYKGESHITPSIEAAIEKEFEKSRGHYILALKRYIAFLEKNGQFKVD